MKDFFKFSFLTFLVFPLLASAQYAYSLQEIIDAFGGFIWVAIIPTIFALALLFFVWGMAIFILNAGNEEKRQEGKQKMLWGVIALFIIASVWGIIGLLQVIFVGGILPTPFN